MRINHILSTEISRVFAVQSDLSAHFHLHSRYDKFFPLLSSVYGALIYPRTNEHFDICTGRGGSAPFSLSIDYGNQIPGYCERLSDIELFVGYGTKVGIFTTHDHCEAWVLVPNIVNSNTTEIVRLICVAIPRLFPSIFADHPLNSDEKELLQSLLENNGDKFINICSQISSKLDFTSVMTKQGLHNIIEGYDSNIQKRTNQEIANITTTIIRLEDNISQYRRRLYDLQRQLSGINAEADRNSELLSEWTTYLKNNEHVKIINSGGVGQATLMVQTYINNYDINEYDKVSSNPNSALMNTYAHSELGISSYVDRKRMLDAIFKDGKYRIRSTANFTINTDTFLVYGDGGSPEIEGYYSNPHIYYAGCTGNYRPLMTEAIQNKDFIAVVELCLASCANLNFADISIMKRFSEDMFINMVDKPFIESPDGDIISPKQLNKKLKEVGICEQTDGDNR